MINIPRSRPSTQIEQRPDFGNIAKRQTETRPSPTQSTLSVDGALPGRRRAILGGSTHSPRLAGQIGGARTEQGRGGGDVRSGRLREPTSTGRAWTTARRGTLGRRCCSARPVWSRARPTMTRRLLGCGLAPTLADVPSPSTSSHGSAVGSLSAVRARRNLYGAPAATAPARCSNADMFSLNLVSGEAAVARGCCGVLASG